MSQQREPVLSSHSRPQEREGKGELKASHMLGTHSIPAHNSETPLRLPPLASTARGASFHKAAPVNQTHPFTAAHFQFFQPLLACYRLESKVSL